jgi:small subunit ribosomal protein S1
VAKLTNFGAFVELEPDLEGLLHISELADHKIDKPQDIVKVGDEVEIKILKVDTDSRKIGLSLRRVQWAAEEQAAESAKKRVPSGPERVLSDADVDRIKKPKDMTDQPEDKDTGVQTTEVDKKVDKVAEPESPDADATETSEPTDTAKKDAETVEEKDADKQEQKTTKNSILGIFKRKKGSSSKDSKDQTPQESTDPADQPDDQPADVSL